MPYFRAASTLLLIAVIFQLPVFADEGVGLPPVKMGKFVDQPGDNQYSVKTQAKRHAGKYFDTNGGEHVFINERSSPEVPAGSRRSQTRSPEIPAASSVPTAFQIDTSIEPIPSEEPVAPPGFPPLPLGLDLKQAGSSAWANENRKEDHSSESSFTGAEYTENLGLRNRPVKSGYRVGTPPQIMRSGAIDNVEAGPTTGKGARFAPTTIPPREGSSQPESSMNLRGIAKPETAAPALDDSLDKAGYSNSPSGLELGQSRAQDLSTLNEDRPLAKNHKGKPYAKQMIKRGQSVGRQLLRGSGF